MNRADLAGRIASHLDVLVNRTGERPTGSPGNREATAYVKAELESLGLRVEYPVFSCIDWEGGPVRLRAGGEEFDAYPGPYSLPFSGSARLETASCVGDLREKRITGAILLIHGELASEPLFPKGFVFYNPEEHQEIIRILEKRKPVAIIAATGQAPFTAGAPYPFPVFEDGDFDIPSAYMKDVDGARLLGHAGTQVELVFEARRIPATGHNVIGTIGSRGSGRVVLTAHIDARKGSPGALDDGAGVAALLGVAELLAGRPDAPAVEFAVLNGEDYYAASGEMAYLEANEGRWHEIRLAINMDDVGYGKGKTAYSFYECAGSLRVACEAALAGFDGLVPGEQWVQGDHSIFVQQGVPALAFISDQGEYLMREFVHTERDTVDLVNPDILAELAEAAAACVTSAGR